MHNAVSFLFYNREYYMFYSEDFTVKGLLPTPTLQAFIFSPCAILYKVFFYASFSCSIRAKQAR
ncbi:hypothetical protein HNR74_000063 [Flammeovirga kamogawensis]|nr:hypothetical protein [Flammeovirga kamogawensis]